ncbi:MAG: hypothetical protein V2I33_11130 [Kangiellaceae bacterium]|jgi:nitrogen fixation/metabolism regulation signal transduction histidine kinase|nr:hypothetical protein [Kangiellaceae bacterium]
MDNLLSQMSPLTMAVSIVIAVFLLFLARQHVHHMLLSFTRILHQSFRLMACSVVGSEKRLALRNKEVLLAAGREQSERIIEREFDRVAATIKNELAEYPSMHRKLSEAIQAIEDDYAKSVDVPPDPTGWSKAIKEVANVEAKGDPMIANVMVDIGKSMNKAEAKAVQAYREASKERHKRLKNMMPRWRAIAEHLGVVDKNIQSVIERGQSLDRHMEEYEHINQGSDRAMRMLSSSALSQFFISLFVLVIAVGGAVINFNLIARPMAEMVGGSSMVGAFKIADISALVIILVEITMGLFLMECLRITRLFPVIHALPDRLRVRMMWFAFTILFILAGVEAGLAFMREILMQEDLAISSYLRGAEVATDNGGVYWITTAAQMGMGFILPFALTFVAIPLENFISSLRTVLGLFAAIILRTIALVMRVMGSVSHQLGRLLVNAYDLVIFMPLVIEQAWKNKKTSAKETTVEQTHEHGMA